MNAILQASMKAEEVRMQRAKSSDGGRFESFRNVFQQVFAVRKQHNYSTILRVAVGETGVSDRNKREVSTTNSVAA